MLRIWVLTFSGVALLLSTAFGCNNSDKDETCLGTVTESNQSKRANLDNPYRACSDAVATGAFPVISDFENCSFGVLPNEGRNGIWYQYDDGSNGTLSMVAKSGVAHITSDNWTNWGSGVSINIGPVHNNTDPCSYDATVYTGVRFRAKGSGHVQLMVATVGNIPINEGGTCIREGNCRDLPGSFTTLTKQWKTVEFPFCRMKSEGWGGSSAPLDLAEIVAIQMEFLSGQNVDLWIDDIEFFTQENADGSISCEVPCPMDLVPYPYTIVPEIADLSLTDRFTLHTFVQETTSCGPIPRRYFRYLPRDLTANSNAPVLIAMHGSDGNAESFPIFLSHNRFDELAERDGFVVIYGNAAPGAHSSDNPNWRNTGSWRQGFYDDGQVDDVAYLAMILNDLVTQSVISGNNDVYLAGLSNGGGMVLKAAREKPKMFKGIAAFMPFDGWEPAQIPTLTGTGLTRMILGYTSADPGLPEFYDDIWAPLPGQWAAALGLPVDAIENPLVTELPNLVNEGETYLGNAVNALRTQNSTVTQLDINVPDVPGSLRILKFNRSGHLWPNPVADTDSGINEQLGFRNQDIDAADAIWSFFRGSGAK